MARSKKMPYPTEQISGALRTAREARAPRQDYILGLKEKRGFCFFLVDLIIFQRLVQPSCVEFVGLAKKFVGFFYNTFQRNEQTLWPTQYLWIKTYQIWLLCWCLPTLPGRKSTSPRCISLIMFAPSNRMTTLLIASFVVPSKGQAGSLSHSTSPQNPWNLEQCLEQTCNFAISMYFFVCTEERTKTPRSSLFSKEGLSLLSSHVIKSHCWIFQHILHPPVSLQFFLLSNRRVPLPLSSGPKAPFASACSSGNGNGFRGKHAVAPWESAWSMCHRVCKVRANSLHPSVSLAISYKETLVFSSWDQPGL